MSREPKRHHLLVIDDDDAMRKLMSRVLQSEHDVTVEAEPHAALARLLAGDEFDLILCDVVMPGMSGIELYKVLVASSPASAAKVLLMTGGGLPRDQEAFLQTCPAPRLAKPFSPAALRERVRELLRGASSAR